MRFVKGFLILIVISIVALAATVAYITQVLDPNDLKPTLVNAAKNQQVQLELRGNIEWTFWPWFGISMDDVSASSNNWRFEADQLEGSLSIFSVLSDTIIIDQLTAIALKVKLELSHSKQPSAMSEDASASESKTILIRQVAVTDGEILGLHPDLMLSRLELSVDSLSPVTASDLLLSAYITFRDYQAPITVRAEIIPTASFDGLTIRQSSIESRDLTLAYDGYLSASSEGQLSGEGQIEVSEFSLRKWLRSGNWPVPDTQNLERLNRLSINTGIKLSNEMISLRPFSLILDETSIDGRIDLSLRPLNVDLELLADRLNLDSYLSSDPSAQPGSTTMPFPLVTGTYKLDFGELTVSSHLVNQVGFDLGVGSDEITLGRLDANLFGGELRLAGTHLIAPQITNITGSMTEMQLSQFEFSKPLDSLSGSLKSTFDLRMAGRTPDEMLASVSGPLRLQIKNAFLGPLNLSDTLCQLSGGNGESIFDAADTLTARAEFQEGIAVIEAVDATVANLNIQGSGRVSLVSTAANIQGTIRVPSDGVLGSCMAPEFLRGVSLPLVCRGQIRNENLACSVDETALQRIMSKMAEVEVKKKAQKQLQQAKDALKSSVQDALQDRATGQGSELLQQLLKQ